MKNILTLCFLFLLCALQLAAQTSGQNSIAVGESGVGQTTSPQPSPSPSAEPETAKPNPETPLSPFVRKDMPARIPRFETAPVIDGQLSDPVWQSAARFGDFLQTQPGDNVAPTHPMEVMMGYDSKNLYLAFRVTEERDKVRATVARRDQIFSDDFVNVYLDTFNDQRQAYILFFNPLGIQGDGTFTEGRGEDYSVDIVMESKGVLTQDGYTIEAAIPFKSLRYEAGKNKQWGIHIFRRIRYANNELDSWMRMDRRRSGWLSQEGHITGLEDISTTRQLEINPSLTLSESGNRVRTIPVADLRANPALQDNGRFINEGAKVDFGFTAKFGLTPTTTLDFAYNPDFAQVEADAPVVTANQRFPIFFPEKRPFFLERIDIFQTPMNIVNTRTIVDPDVALKLTGRRGKNTFGVLYASDKYPGFTRFTEDERTDPTLRRGIERFLGENADIGVLRLKHDIGSQHNLGFFATTYNFVERHNHTAGLDGRFRLDPKTTVQFQSVGTNSRAFFYDPDLDRSLYRTGNGFGYYGFLERADRHLYMNYLAVGRSPDYRANVGFTQRVDTNYLGSYIRYETERDQKKAIIYKRFQNATNISYDWSGRSQYFISETGAALAMKRQTYLYLDFQYGYERVFEHEFGANRTATRQGAFSGPSAERSSPFKALNGFIETTPSKRFYLFTLFDYTVGLMDYDLGAGPDFPRASRAALAFGQGAPLDPGPGNQLTIDSVFRYQPTSAFQTQLNYTKRRLVRHDTGLVAFDDNLFSSRSTYQFSRNTFARLRLDYSTLNTHLRPQLVVGWTPNPGTALYLGYNDDLSYNGYNQFTGQFEPGLRGNGRTFFIKASYLFRKSF